MSSVASRFGRAQSSHRLGNTPALNHELMRRRFAKDPKQMPVVMTQKEERVYETPPIATPITPHVELHITEEEPMYETPKCNTPVPAESPNIEMHELFAPQDEEFKHSEEEIIISARPPMFKSRSLQLSDFLKPRKW